jgi:plastocyanin
MVRGTMKQMTSVIVSTSFLVLLILCPHKSAVMGEETKLQPQLHKIILSNSPEGISPGTIRMNHGDTVVWYNTGEEPVVISFLKEVGIVCSPIINFYADLSGGYKTQAIPRGGTASLCFIRQGEYEYEVKKLLQKDNEKPTEHILQGKVIVD